MLWERKRIRATRALGAALVTLLLAAWISGCGETGNGSADATAPIEPYLDEEKLENAEEEDFLDATGANDLSDADADRIVALQEPARRWFEAITPVWENLNDPDAPLSEFVARFEAARPELFEALEAFSEIASSIDDPGLAKFPSSLARSLEEILMSFDALVAAESNSDEAALRAAVSQVDAATTELQHVVGEYLAGLRAYFDAEGFCEDQPDGGVSLGELCLPEAAPIPPP